MSTIDRAEYAAELKNYRGYNCCQAVTAALADETDMPKDQLKMIAGLKTEGSRTLIYTKQIVDEFKKNCGAVRCRDLKGIGTGKVLCPCDDCVRNAVRAYEKVMANYPG